MFNTIRTAVLTVILFTVITGLLYPLMVTGLAQILFPAQARGSLASKNGELVGSYLIGQHFDDPKYFWGRPSATAPYPYNAASSGGSNHGPSNPALFQAARARISALQALEPGNEKAVPVDLVTSSGSGLDPHISPAAAEYQVGRVAKVRHLDEAEVRALVVAYTEGRQLGILGEPRINVLRLNLALDELPGSEARIHMNDHQAHER